MKLPDFSSITLEVDDVSVTPAEIEEQLTALRARFGTLTAVEKTVENGDFVSIDLVAKVDGKEIEGGTVLQFEAGQAFVESINILHNGKNTGTEPLKIIAFYSGEKGKPVTVKKE